MLTRTSPLVVLLGLCLAVSASAQLCPPPILPALPVPQYRLELPGQSIWPLDALGNVILKPASPIDEDRNSTAYNTYCPPGAEYGLELFHDLAAVPEHPKWLFVAYNAGIQVWDIEADPADPTRVRLRDGWLDQLEIFPDWGEGDTYIERLAAHAVPGEDAVYLAAGGRSGHGISLWRFDPATLELEQFFQDTSRWFRDLEMAEHDDRVYLFATDPSDSDGGVLVYDVAAAEASPCFDSTWPFPCGSLVGHVGDLPDAAYVDTLKIGGELYVVASDGSGAASDPLGVEIWHVADPAHPGAAPAGDSVRLFSGLESNHRGVQLIDLDGRRLLATLYVDPTANPDLTVLRFYDVTSCLDADGCVSLGAPVWSEVLPPIEGKYQYLTVSKSGPRTFLYYGLETTAMFGSRVEQLLDITGLTPFGSGEVEEVTEPGASYRDPLTGVDVDYWGDYYGSNTYGLENLLPRHGIFVGPYFYRAALGVLDVHRYTPPAQLLIDGFESGDCAAWSAVSSPGPFCG